MSNTDICTCDYFPHCQDVICMTCGKSQKHAGEVLRQLMAENERLRSALEACDHLAGVLQMALKEVTP